MAAGQHCLQPSWVDSRPPPGGPEKQARTARHTHCHQLPSTPAWAPLGQQVGKEDLIHHKGQDTPMSEGPWTLHYAQLPHPIEQEL